MVEEINPFVGVALITTQASQNTMNDIARDTIITYTSYINVQHIPRYIKVRTDCAEIVKARKKIMTPMFQNLSNR